MQLSSYNFLSKDPATFKDELERPPRIFTASLALIPGLYPRLRMTRANALHRHYQLNGVTVQY